MNIVLFVVLKANMKLPSEIEDLICSTIHSFERALRTPHVPAVIKQVEAIIPYTKSGKTVEMAVCARPLCRYLSNQRIMWEH